MAYSRWHSLKGTELKLKPYSEASAIEHSPSCVTVNQESVTLSAWPPHLVLKGKPKLKEEWQNPQVLETKINPKHRDNQMPGMQQREK